MKTLKFLSVLLLTAMLLASCVTNSFYQVYKATPSDTTLLKDNLLVYEDQNCEVFYNLWDEGGNIGFRFYNKSNENIYLNLEESFYVLNGMAYNYYKNRTYTNSTSSGATNPQLNNRYPVNIITNQVYSVSFNEEKIVCIPPKTSKVISEYTINKSLIRDCDLYKYPTKRKIKTKSFTQENSPLIFSNKIAYTIGQSKNLIRFENQFYISEITNYPEGEVLESKGEEFCGESTGTIITYLNNASADKFYIRYLKVDNAKH